MTTLFATKISNTC